METSTTISELAKALTKFQSEVGGVKKDGVNPYFKSKYATLENVIATIKEPLAKNGLSFSQFPTGENELCTILLHNSGEFIKATAKMSPKENSPQAQGSAITYLRRYALSAVLGLATEEDDDGNAATQKRKKDNLPEGFLPPLDPQNTPKSPSQVNETPKKAQLLVIAGLLAKLGYKPKTKKEADDLVKRLTETDVITAATEELDEAIEKLEIIIKQK